MKYFPPFPMTEIHIPDEAPETCERAMLFLRSDEPSTPDIEIMLWPGWLKEVRDEEQAKA